MATRAKGSVWEIEARDVEAAGLAAADASVFLAALRSAAAGAADETAAWAAAAATVLRPEHPHALHQLVYYSVFAGWDRAARGPPPYWFPSPADCKQTNLGRLMEANGHRLLGSAYKDPISSFNLFHKFSVENQETDDSTAIVWRDEGLDDYPVKRMSLKELRTQVMTVANALDTMFQKGDRIAIDMPMTCNAVIIYLAIILGGFVVVSIADSFAPQEIRSRMEISKAVAIFTQASLSCLCYIL
ncbi:hypothetical protein PR202_gb10570 [Eleusine coracana subsp. coracana]|uniref:AMP-dependent synthetase/ligase domain-containing protein n=1 Tax=Eleusine coracana subsp. coracana TaxID=191504 RepID=A0AAV5EL20_ELECO|nr:hypothetical protein PR202_gb10570 [Eleusine coracana subsp. coracana]